MAGEEVNAWVLTADPPRQHPEARATPATNHHQDEGWVSMGRYTSRLEFSKKFQLLNWMRLVK